MSWYLLGWRRWSDFGGRSTQREYVAFIYPIYLGVFLLVSTTSTGSAPGDPPPWLAIAILAIFFVTVVPVWAVTVRRMHDINLPGGLLVLGAFIPGLNFLYLILLSLIPGSRGENNYGDEAGLPSDYLGKI